MITSNCIIEGYESKKLKENFKMERSHIFTMPFSSVYPLIYKRQRKKGEQKKK
jgi:hypothetical protein